jgi:TatD DNase family protein
VIDLVDTHCHLNFDSYDKDQDEVVQRAAAAGVNRIIIPAIDLNSAKDALRLSHRYPGVYAAVGIHPNSSADFLEKDTEAIALLAGDSKVVGIGEIGLDYYRDRSPRNRQQTAFQAQLALAAELELPVIIHNREAGDDVLSILEDWVSTLTDSLRARPGVLHSFSASQEIADRALAIGFFIGFTGPITFKNAGPLRQVAATVPLDRILVETDGPFLTPVPFRGKRNEPGYIPYIVERLASLKTVSTDALAQTTTANASFLFDLPPSN